MSTSVKVNRQIPDISPTLTLRRDKAYTTYPANRKRYALPSMEVIKEIEPNYAWTRLPNMGAYKSAIVRNKVCEGLMYLLPGNKNSASLARPYTAELGAIFTEPYMNFKPQEYNEENVKQSSGIHFSPNTHITRLSKHRGARRIPPNLNSDSRKSYNDYNALVSKKNKSINEESGGKGNLPVPVKVGPAEVELQNEVQHILDEVDVHGAMDDSEGDRPYSSLYNSSAGRRISSNNKTNCANTASKTVRFNQNAATPISTKADCKPSVEEFRDHHYDKKAAKFKDYKELRSADVPRPQLPEEYRSQYLSESKAAEIWDWLNWDFEKTKFEHFIEVCS